MHRRGRRSWPEHHRAFSTSTKRSHATDRRSGTASPARPSSSSPTSPTPPPSPSASATPPSARKPARSTTRCAAPSASNGGTVIDAKTLGDGVLATFPAASQAIAAALHAAKPQPRRTGLPLHVGLHAGDVIREVRQRLRRRREHRRPHQRPRRRPARCSSRAPSRDLARTSAGVTFEDRGEHALKGIAEPQRVFAVRKDASDGTRRSATARARDGVRIAYAITVTDRRCSTSRASIAPWRRLSRSPSPERT